MTAALAIVPEQPSDNARTVAQKLLLVHALKSAWHQVPKQSFMQFLVTLFCRTDGPADRRPPETEDDRELFKRAIEMAGWPAGVVEDLLTQFDEAGKVEL